MSSSLARTIALAPHPDGRGGAIRAVHARVARMPSGVLRVNYILEGDLDRVRIPSSGPARRADRLWEHTCCELFVARKGATAYHEFNFAPSGEWAAYAFERYRQRTVVSNEAAALTLTPQITVRRNTTTLEVDASIRLDRLSAIHVTAALSLALSAVVENRDGSLSFWALAHPPGKPDFHHPDSFTLTLDEVRH